MSEQRQAHRLDSALVGTLPAHARTVSLSSLRQVLTLTASCAGRGNRPSEVELARWLPIFIDGVREYREPYRFLAIRGSQALVAEAGPKLHQFATELVSSAPVWGTLCMQDTPHTQDQQVATVWSCSIAPSSTECPMCIR